MIGALARTAELPWFEPRPQQDRYATAVADALEAKSISVIEAPTGVGKTLGYLVPVFLWQATTGDRCIVSTHTKALQAQLAQDVGLASTLTGLYPRVEVLKGKQNYACLLQVDIAAGDLLRTTDASFTDFWKWVRDTDTGDIDDLPTPYAGWNEISAATEACRGKACPYFQRCFYYEALRRASDSKILIVNHSLYMADLKARSVFGVIPPHSAVVFDEAHRLESAATGALTTELNLGRLYALLGRAQSYAGQLDAGLAGALVTAQGYCSALTGAFAASGEREYFMSEGAREVDRSWLPQACLGLTQQLEFASDELERLAKSMPDPISLTIAGIAGACRTNAETCADLFGEADNGFIKHGITTTSGSSTNVRLFTTPIEIGPMLAAKVWSSIPTCVLTSATLSTLGNFNYIKRRLGITTSIDTRCESPFDYQRQAILYTPQRMSDPPAQLSQAYLAQTADEIALVLSLTRGSAFVLCTSFSTLDALYARLSPVLPYTCMKQGDAPPMILLDRFKGTPGAVLFATSSFWEGVDVKGDALRAVIVDRIPFEVPTAPLYRARQENVLARGGNWFSDVALPTASLKLKQGVGRLIRSTTDTGIIVILDNRITSKPYGRLIVADLPPASRTTEWAETADRWRRMFEPQLQLL